MGRRSVQAGARQLAAARCPGRRSPRASVAGGRAGRRARGDLAARRAAGRAARAARGAPAGAGAAASRRRRCCRCRERIRYWSSPAPLGEDGGRGRREGDDEGGQDGREAAQWRRHGARVYPYALPEPPPPTMAGRVPDRRTRTSCSSPTATGPTRRAAGPARPVRPGRRWLAWGHGVTVIAGDYPGADARSSRYAEPDRPPDGHAADGLPARRLGDPPRRRPRRRRRPRGRQRHRVLHAAVAVAARRRRSRSSTTSTRTTTSPSWACRAGSRRSSPSACRCAPLPRRARPDDLAGRPRRPRRARRRRATTSTSPTWASTERRPASRARSAEPPTLLYLGRLKQYKRIEVVLDVLAGVPEAHARHRRRRRPPPGARAGDRRARPADRVTLHGHVTEEEKQRALRPRVGQPHRLVGRGLVPDRHGGGARAGTPSAALRVGGLHGVDRRRADRPAGRRRPTSSPSGVRDLVADPPAPRRARRRRPGARPRLHVGPHGRAEPRGHGACRGGRTGGRTRLRSTFARSETAQGRRAWRARRWLTTRSSSSSRSSSRACSASATTASLAALVSTFLILVVAGQSHAGRRRARDGARPPRRRRPSCGARCGAGCERLLVAARGR